MQLSLFDGGEKILKAKEIEKKRKEISQGIYKCSICGEKGKYGEEIFWFNGGALFPSHFYAHVECYTKRLQEGFNFIDRGYKEVDGVIKIFSQTTGWEDIKIEDVRGVSDNILGNPVFPYIVRTSENTFGITKECKEYLEGKGIEYEKLEIEEITYLEERENYEFS